MESTFARIAFGYDPKMKLYFCRACAFVCENKDDISKHNVLDVHANIAQEYTCSICSEAFSSSEGLSFIKHHEWHSRTKAVLSTPRAFFYDPSDVQSDFTIATELNIWFQKSSRCGICFRLCGIDVPLADHVKSKHSIKLGNKLFALINGPRPPASNQISKVKQQLQHVNDSAPSYSRVLFDKSPTKVDACCSKDNEEACTSFDESREREQHDSNQDFEYQAAEHATIHDPGTASTMHCTSCHVIAFSFVQMILHVHFGLHEVDPKRIAHCDKRFICCFCGHRYSWSSSLHWHLEKLHHKETKDIVAKYRRKYANVSLDACCTNLGFSRFSSTFEWSCLKCRYQSVTREDMILHSACAIHPNTDHSFHCSFCTFVSMDGQVFINHTRNCHPTRSKELIQLMPPVLKSGIIEGDSRVESDSGEETSAKRNDMFGSNGTCTATFSLGKQIKPDPDGDSEMLAISIDAIKTEIDDDDGFGSANELIKVDVAVNCLSNQITLVPGQGKCEQSESIKHELNAFPASSCIDVTSLLSERRFDSLKPSNLARLGLATDVERGNEMDFLKSKCNTAISKPVYVPPVAIPVLTKRLILPTSKCTVAWKRKNDAKCDDSTGSSEKFRAATAPLLIDIKKEPEEINETLTDQTKKPEISVNLNDEIKFVSSKRTFNSIRDYCNALKIRENIVQTATEFKDNSIIP